MKKIGYILLHKNNITIAGHFLNQTDFSSLLFNNKESAKQYLYTRNDWKDYRVKKVKIKIKGVKPC